MEYTYILVRFGELSTKGKNKKDFIKQLLNNIKNALKSFEKLTYERTHDRLYIHLNGENFDAISEKLVHVFGIRSFSPALKITSDIDTIVEQSYELVKHLEGTFKVETKRNDKKFPLVSDEINRMVETKILKETTLKVDVHHPDTRIQIEIRSEATYLMTKTIIGAQGFPVGIGGKAIVMLSGGIDSVVAAYLAMKRGIAIECVHYASPPYTSQNALDKVLELAATLTQYQPKIRVHIVPFTKLQLEIYEHCDESYAITIMRRMMYRIAKRLCDKQKALAIVNGESIGQVASQTLESMATINEVVYEYPTIRPLACFDKLEIIDLAKKIGSYEISIQPFDDCCTIFAPVNPVTRPTVKKALINESKFDYEACIEELMQEIQVENVMESKKMEDTLF